jgi:hypothetical protein
LSTIMHSPTKLQFAERHLHQAIIPLSHTVLSDYSSAQVHYPPSPQEASSMRHIAVLAPPGIGIGIGTPALLLPTRVDSDWIYSSSVSNTQRTSSLPKVRQQPQPQRQYLQSHPPKAQRNARPAMWSEFGSWSAMLLRWQLQRSSSSKW